jgi:hypothetical protein
VAKLLADAYSNVYEALSNPQNGYTVDGNIAGSVKHTPAQVSAFSSNTAHLSTVIPVARPLRPYLSPPVQVATILGVS